MLVDDLLPSFDFRMHHEIRIAASRERVFNCLRTANFDVWGFSRLLYAMRTLPALPTSPQETWHRFALTLRRPHFTLNDLLATGFTLLGSRTYEELVIGTVGRFWRARGELRAVSREDFVGPARPGTAKAAWNFTVSRASSGAAELRTETRVLCADIATRRRLLRYWAVIRPFSGLIRREMLAAIRSAAETHDGTPPLDRRP